MAEQQLPHHEIPGINARQADSVVGRAFQVNALREFLNHPDETVAESARRLITEHEDMIGTLAGPRTVASTVEIVPVRPDHPTPPHNRESSRPRILQVVDPASDRIVDYGQMRHGNHPQGGRIVGYR